MAERLLALGPDTADHFVLVVTMLLLPLALLI
jgi:hypothetical protein